VATGAAAARSQWDARGYAPCSVVLHQKRVGRTGGGTLSRQWARARALPTENGQRLSRSSLVSFECSARNSTCLSPTTMAGARPVGMKPSVPLSGSAVSFRPGVRLNFVKFTVFFPPKYLWQGMSSLGTSPPVVSPSPTRSRSPQLSPHGAPQLCAHRYQFYGELVPANCPLAPRHKIIPLPPPSPHQPLLSQRSHLQARPRWASLALTTALAAAAVTGAGAVSCTAAEQTAAADVAACKAFYPECSDTCAPYNHDWTAGAAVYNGEDGTPATGSTRVLASSAGDASFAAWASESRNSQVGQCRLTLSNPS
jgi:hypothetical protein